MKPNLSPARYSAWPAATLRRPKESRSRQAVSLPDRPQGRHRSRRWQAEQLVCMGATLLRVRAVASAGTTGMTVKAVWAAEAAVAVDIMVGFCLDSMGMAGCADGVGEPVDLDGLVEEAENPAPGSACVAEHAATLLRAGRRGHRCPLNRGLGILRLAPRNI